MQLLPRTDRWKKRRRKRGTACRSAFYACPELLLPDRHVWKSTVRNEGIDREPLAGRACRTLPVHRKRATRSLRSDERPANERLQPRACYSLPRYDYLDSLLTKGNGPNEFIQAPWVSSATFFNERDELHAGIYDFQRGRVFNANITQTLKTGKLDMHLMRDSLPPFLFNFFIIDSDKPPQPCA